MDKQLENVKVGDNLTLDELNDALAEETKYSFPDMFDFAMVDILDLDNMQGDIADVYGNVVVYFEIEEFIEDGDIYWETKVKVTEIS